MDKSSVPKFGSFKPKSSTKPSSIADPAPAESSRSNGRERDSERDRKKRHRDSRRRDERQHHHGSDSDQPRDRHHRRREERPKSLSPEPVTAPAEWEESELFFVDRRGDAKNVTYGTLHRYSIPNYRTAGYGKVIGIPLSRKIDRDESNEKEIVLMSTDRNGRNRPPRLLASKRGRLNEQRLRFVTNDSLDVANATDSDYIELSNSRKRKRGDDFSSADLVQAATVDYRSIEGKAKQPSQPEDQDLSFASDSESDGADEDISLQHRQGNAVLSKRAKTNPSLWEHWQALVEHQAKLVRPGVDASSFNTSERKTLADLRLSILNEAAWHISKGKPGYEALLLASIEEGRHIWDSAKLAGKWKEALSDCPGSILLWTKHLDYIQHSHATFRYETCRDAYLRCLAMLKVARLKNDVNVRAIAEVQVFVLLRLTCLIRDAGYDELAIAIWQAIMELHLSPQGSDDQSSPPDNLDSFEEFWESEAPRIGEEGAVGWNISLASDTSPRRNPTKPPPTSFDSRDPLRSFAKGETKLRGFILPATMDDEDATMDPFRCVMFSDIRDVLDSVVVQLPKNLLTQAFLIYMGLPLLPVRAGGFDARLWLLDQHINAGCDTSLEAEGSTWTIPTTNNLFDDAFETFCKKHDANSSDTESCARFVDRVLASIIAEKDSDDLLAEYYLAFKLHLFPDEAAKTAKRFLKARPSSLRLYNAYALIQARLKGLDQALNVWTLALGMVDKIESSAKDDAVLLWNSRFHAQLSTGHEDDALQTLLGLANPAATKVIDGQNDHTRRLKTIRIIEEAIDRTILSGKLTLAVLGVDCLAWLQYLLNNHSLTIALDVYSKYELRLKPTPAALEHLHQTKCHLLQSHINQKRPYKPSLVLSELQSSLAAFPNNSLLLSLHSQIATQDRLRAMFRQEQTAPITSIAQWTHHLATEIEHLRTEMAGATVNSARASFSKALLSIDSEVSHSPALWMGWLRFEYSVTIEKGQGLEWVKRVFLDGMRYLPWYKNWVVTGMDMLSWGGMSAGELKQVYETMMERGLRVKIDIEDLL